MKTFEESRLRAAPANVEPGRTEPVAQPTQRIVVARPVVGGLAFPAQRSSGAPLPEGLRTGVEQLSGVSLDGVTVHYDSDRPAQVGALAYTQGSEIHVGPGQEEHLPHEAWHVVQQAQGRVRPTMQLKGTTRVNDDHGLEHEADVMGARAVRWQRGGTRLLTASQLQKGPAATSTAAVQMVRIIKKGIGSPTDRTPKSWPDEGKIPEGFRLAKPAEILAYTGKDEGVLAEQKKLKASADRKKTRKERRSKVPSARLPSAGTNREVNFPVVVQGADGIANLVYRGMSPDNVKNMLSENDIVFRTQTLGGTDTPVQQIVDDSVTSPYLSFEAEGLGVSAGKYAPKPVDAKNRPKGVDIKDGGFLKGKKSYTTDAREESELKKEKRLGYVGGIASSPDHVDLSTKEKAEKAIPKGSVEEQKRRKAINIAVSDKEVLVKPGPGIPQAGLLFVAKVKEVDEAYFLKNVIHQKPKMALGFFRPRDKKPIYTKIEIIKGDYSFTIPAEMKRNDEDSESEMSEIEDMNFDFSEDETEDEKKDEKKTD
ncbi:DUF4157 domain-containing protein [Cellulomonas sp. URHD0024]|uniref:eCIS core domain-containing protein n=1 Tax=Cellulomonas sp. URHD0024 TaxID=1302620 RepID=UPI0004143374|nr:DUF4157 domain-containing protein [Cellulomonas sp. URHD0024]